LPSNRRTSTRGGGESRECIGARLRAEDLNSVLVDFADRQPLTDVEVDRLARVPAFRGGKRRSAADGPQIRASQSREETQRNRGESQLHLDLALEQRRILYRARMRGL
jgi:hypothetical protein